MTQGKKKKKKEDKNPVSGEANYLANHAARHMYCIVFVGATSNSMQHGCIFVCLFFRIL